MRTRSYIAKFLLVLVYQFIMGSLPFDTMVESHIYVLLDLYICMFLASRGGAFFVIDMSNSKQPSIPKGSDVIVCRNPFCSRGQNALATEAALQNLFWLCFRNARDSR